MSDINYFFIVFLLTVLLTRIGVFIGVWLIRKYKKKAPKTKIFGFRIHHYMYGLILMVIGFIMKNITIYAIGFGLFVDELPYLLMRGKTHEDNYSFIANVGVVVFVIVVYLAKNYLLWN